MFAREKTWQDIDISSQSESGWDNVVVLNLHAVDIRFKLKGYGWKPNANDENLNVLYEGRYVCYYRERYTSTWTKFATVNSERASVEDSNVYKDIFVELGLVPEKIYEVKIVAADAEKFQGWGGAIETISEDDQFWYDFKLRGNSPYKLEVFENINVGEWVYDGKEIIEMPTVFDEISISELTERKKVVLMSAYDNTYVDSYVNIEVNKVINVYEDISVVEWFGTSSTWVNVATPFDLLGIEEYTNILLNPVHANFFEELSPVEEWVSLGLDPLYPSDFYYENISIEENINIFTVPPWPIWDANEEIDIEEVFGYIKFIEKYVSDCSSLTGWVDESTGDAGVAVDSGSFLFSAGESSDMVLIKRETGENLSNVYYVEFKIKFISAAGDSPSLGIKVAGATKNASFRIGQSMISGLAIFYGATIVFDIGDAKDQWMKIHMLCFEPSAGARTIAYLYCNDIYIGQTEIESLFSNYPNNGGIWFWDFNLPYQNYARIDDIVLGNASDDNIITVFVREPWADPIEITEYINLNVIYFEPYSISVIENISVTENISINIYGVVEAGEDISVTEFTDISVTPLYQGLLSDVLYWSEYVELVVFNPDYSTSNYDDIAVTEDIAFDLGYPIDIYDDLTVISELAILDTWQFLLEEYGETLTNWVETENGTSSITQASGIILLNSPDGASDCDMKQGVAEGYNGMSHILIELVCKVVFSASAGSVGIVMQGSNSDDNPYDYKLPISFLYDGTLNLGDNAIASAFNEDQYYTWKFEIWGGSQRAFMRAYRDGVLIGYGYKDAASSGPECMVEADGSGAGDSAKIWVDKIMVQGFDDFYGYIGNPFKFSLNYEDITITESSNILIPFLPVICAENINVQDYAILWGLDIGLYIYENINIIENFVINRIVGPMLFSVNASTVKILKHSAFTPTITDSFSSPSTGPKGLTWDGNNIYSADTILNKIYQHTGFSSSITDSFSSPSTSPTGLTFDGTNIYSADEAANKIYQHTGFSSSITDSFASPSDWPQGLAWDETDLYSTDNDSDKIYQHDGFSSSILDSFSSPSLAPTGLAWDGANILSSDSLGYAYKHIGFSASISDSFSLDNASGLAWGKEPEIDVYEDITATENVSLDIFSSIDASVYDDITALENINIALSLLYISIYDEAAITENIETVLTELNLSVYEDLTITEVGQINDIVIELGIVDDDITVTENLALSVGYAVSVYEDITSITENIDIYLDVLNVDVYEDLTITEVGQINDIVIELGIVDDDIAITEDVTLSIPVVSANLYSIDYHADKIYQHDGFSSVIDDSFSSPSTEPAGLTFDGTNIYSNDENTDKIYKHTGFSSSITDSFSSPSGLPTGQAWDGTNIYSADYLASSGKIYKHDGFSSSILDSFSSPGTALLGLTFDGTNIYSSDGGPDKVYQHTGFSSSINDSFSSPGSAVFGTTWDGSNIMTCDAGTDKIYKHIGFSSSISDSFVSPSTNPQDLGWG